MASQEDFLSSICLWSISWAPQDWVLCAGQLLQVRAYSPLFALLGARYGGNGSTTFGVPNMSGNFPVGVDVTTPGTPFTLGITGGNSKITLTSAQTGLGLHSHTSNVAVAIKASNSAGGANQPGGFYLAMSPGGDGYSDQTDGEMAPMQVTASLGTSVPVGSPAPVTPFNSMPPYLVLNYIINTSGIYPDRP